MENKTIKISMNIAITAGCYVEVEIPEEEYNSENFDPIDWIPEEEILRRELDMDGGVDVISTEISEN